MAALLFSQVRHQPRSRHHGDQSRSCRQYIRHPHNERPPNHAYARLGIGFAAKAAPTG